MRVGLFGNIANNSYILGKLLRKRGIDVELILDPQDTFAFSQPLWEDCDFVLDADTVMGGKTDWDFWNEKAQSLGWSMPEWVKHVNKSGYSVKTALLKGLRDPSLVMGAIAATQKSKAGVLFAVNVLPVVESLSDFDLLVVYGFGPIYAKLSRVPFVAIPYGADLTVTAFKNDILGFLQRSAYNKAKRILIGDPHFVDSLRKLNVRSRWDYFPCPVDTDQFQPAKDTKDKDAVFESLPNCKGKTIFFMPSRQDFFWKGIDKALRAFLKLAQEREDIALIAPSWGLDTAAARQLVKDNNGENSVMFLPYALSKRRLARFHHAADVVLDQFTLGIYGTTTLEAMACEKPVIANIDSEMYGGHFQHLPPILQAGSEDEIFNAMKKAADNPESLAAIGKESRKWVLSEHVSRPINLLENLIRSYS